MTHPTDKELGALVEWLDELPCCHDGPHETSARCKSCEKTAADAITTLRAELSAANARADRAEAERAAQIEVDAGIADRAADADHKYLLKYPDEANRYDFSRHRSETIASAIRAQLHDRTALDRMLAEARARADRAEAVLAAKDAEIARLREAVMCGLYFANGEANRSQFETLARAAISSVKSGVA